MGTWMKETDQAIYLMEGGGYLASVAKRPSQTNPTEQIADITPLQSWFTRSDPPRRMTVSIGTGAPEPEPIKPNTTGIIEHNGQLLVVNNSYFKISPKNASDLNNQEKVFVKQGSIFSFKTYQDVGNYHWLIELINPFDGYGTTTAWYIFTPHIRLRTDAILTVASDTFFKLEPKLSSELATPAKVLLKAGTPFNLASFLPATGNHTQIELADTTLGPNNGTLWYIYNLHFTSETLNTSADPDGMQIQVVKDTYFTLSPTPPGELPTSQKVLVRKGTLIDIQSYTDMDSIYWLIQLVNPVIGDGKTTSWYIDTRDTKLVSNITLTVLEGTTFKLAPQQSSALPDTSKVPVPKDTKLSLISHLPAAANHTRIELTNSLGSREETIWYAYNPHITIAGQRQFLQVVSDTMFKRSTAASSDLSEDDKFFVKRNTVFELSSYQQPRNNHIKVFLKGALLGSRQQHVWYCYLPDIHIIGTEIGNFPDDSNSAGQGGAGDRGIPLQLPGFSGTYYANDPIFKTTQYGEKGQFTWGEALHVDPKTGNYRPPTSADVVTGIQRIAKVLEDIRKRYGDRPITIKSWYRDAATNQAVGGTSQSRHLRGDAVDFVIPGIHPYTVYADLDAWWGSKGGLASSSTFTHIDARGYQARWDYEGSRNLNSPNPTNGDTGDANSPDPASWGSWVKETDRAIYLMRENAWVSRILKSPSPSNPQEQVLDVAAMAAWFGMTNAPAGMTFAIGTGAAEPEEWVEPPDPGHTGETNAAGIEMIKHFEGLRTTAYQDSVGVWTIGYGHTSMAGPPTVSAGMTITAAEAEAILKQDLDVFERGVANALTVITNADQFSALVSFAFNVGLGALRSSTLLRKHNAGDVAGAADEFPRWVYAGGEVLPGLERRRKAERALYLSEDYHPFTGGAIANQNTPSYTRVAAITAGVAAIAGFAYGVYTQFINPSSPDQPPPVPEEINPPVESPTESPVPPADPDQPVG